MVRSTVWSAALLLFVAGCSEDVGKKDGGAGGGRAGGDGAEIAIDVPASGRAFVALAKPEVVKLSDDGSSSTAWDLAFSGYDVLTNGGLDGPGRGGALPLEIADYESGDVPDNVIFLQDDAGGAFARWYAYDPDAHVVWSRFHVYGVKDEGRIWKVQIITFYGQVQGAPVSALYHIRYAEVPSTGPTMTVDLKDIDATSGGSSAPPTSPSACLNLATGQQQMLTPAKASASTTWHLCFRRAIVSVNGESGGPGKTSAVDLNLADTDKETLDQVKMRTADSEASKFDAVGYPALTAPALQYRGDRIVTAFTDRWLEPGANPPAPKKGAAWLIKGADGDSRFLLAIDRFEGATASSPGRVVMRVKPLK